MGVCRALPDLDERRRPAARTFVARSRGWCVAFDRTTCRRGIRSTSNRNAGSRGVFEEMVHDLRALLRLAQGKQEQPTAAMTDTLQSTPESYDGYKRKKGSKIHMAVDTLGYLLALKVTPANEQERTSGRKATATMSK